MYRRLTIIMALLLSLLGVATPVQAHISTCNITKVGVATMSPSAKMVGGFAGEFKCDEFDNHHEFVAMRGEVQMMTLNLPGERMDQWSTIKSSLVRTNTERQRASINSVGFCPQKGRMTVRMRFTIDIVGDSGIRHKYQSGIRTTGACM